MDVYKPSKKSLRAAVGSVISTDRYVFTDSNTAILYDYTTNDVIEPFMIKSLDSFVVLTDESFPQLRISETVRHMYRNIPNALESVITKFNIQKY